MSIDLDWLKLDTSLADHVVDLLNRQLEAVERPSFIGPVHVASLDFGSNAPDVELVDMKDIYRDFLEDDDDDEDRGPVKVTEGGIGIDEDDGFEWVSRRAGVMRDSMSSPTPGLHHLPPHVRHSGFSTSSDYFSSPMMPNLDAWNSGGFSVYGTHTGRDVPTYTSPSPATPFVTTPNLSPGHLSKQNKSIDVDDPFISSSTPPPPQREKPPPNPHPNLQLHLHINWHSNLRISLQTSLLINYPSPMFMSLPIRLSVTGLVFNGEVVVAYQGERKRIHICILDDLDPYGPLGGQRMSGLDTDLNSSLNSSGDAEVHETMKTGSGPTTLELDDSIIMGAAGLGLGSLNTLGVGNATLSIPNGLDTRPSSTGLATSAPTNKPFGYNPTTHTRPSKPVLPVGQRLLPSIYIESEIGQTDKHVLKNVTRVERFIQDVVRKTLEEELVFPNYHTIVMGQ
jgi:distribution and morphology protein 12